MPAVWRVRGKMAPGEVVVDTRFGVAAGVIPSQDGI